MDDLKIVREAYGEPRPDAQLKARIEARLAAETRPRRKRWPVFVPAGLLAAAAAVLSLLYVQSPPPPVAQKPAELSARSILLAAAETAATSPEGRYWRLHMIQSVTGVVAGGEPYTILASQQFDRWAAKEGTENIYQRELAAKPLGEQDEAAWKQAGSPDTFKVANNDDSITYRTTDGPWDERVVTEEDLAQAKEMCEKPEFREKCRRVPDSAPLKERMFPREGGSVANKIQQAYVFLIEAPVSPEERAEAFRLLAEVPGVRSKSDVTAPDGRKGVAIVGDGEMIDGSGVTFEYEMIFDPKTSTVIGDRMTITAGTYRGLTGLLNESTIKSAGWTEASPSAGGQGS
ncbi:CU044_5270 family protein [Herbidospora sp. RD11066]